MNSPILNFPYKEPAKHFKSDERGLTEEILEFRRPSSFYIPVPRAKSLKKRAGQNVAEGAFGSELQQDNEFINKIRDRNKPDPRLKRRGSGLLRLSLIQAFMRYSPKESMPGFQRI